MKLQRAVIVGQNGAVAAYERDGLFMPSLGLEGYVLFKADNLLAGVRLAPKLDFSWLFLSAWAENVNLDGINYKIDVLSLLPPENSLISINVNVASYSPAPLIITPEMQLKVQGINSLKSLIIIGKPVDTLDKYPF